MYNQQTLLAAANAGYVVTLDKKCGKVTINTDGAIHYKVGSGPAPATPTNAYIPGSGLVVSTLHLPAGGEAKVGEDPDGKGFVDALQDPIEWVAIWALSANYVRILGH